MTRSTSRQPEQPAPNLGPIFDENRRYLWGLCYRMTGCAADAEDLVQDTFARAVERPPADTSKPWRPWLVRVAMNLSRDWLRRRQHRAYTGPWLPSPVETDVELEERVYEPRCTEGHYELLESVSLAFLVTLESLSPSQRAVLLLRDVFEYSGRETAEALEMSGGSVRTTLHRARASMRDYDESRRPPDPALAEQFLGVLGRFLEHVTEGDVDAVEAMLAAEVVQLSDGGDDYFAAKVPVVGRSKVARFQIRLAELGADRGLRAEVRVLNGLPALVCEFERSHGRNAPRAVIAGELDGDGRIRRLYSILADRKLSAVAPVHAAEA